MFPSTQTIIMNFRNLIFTVAVPALCLGGTALALTFPPKDKECDNTCCGSSKGTVYGRLYPERADDVAWENEVVGFRIYGPGTQKKNEKAYGYDIFFKHPTCDLIVEKLYEPETNPATWVKVDSLRKIDPKLADEFISTFSYHIDHGLGMDCYAVGPTLGDGVAAILDGDSICFPWCYEKATVLENGPKRFTVRLDFAPVAKGADKSVTEHRLITLDSGSHLNKCKVWFDGLSGSRKIVAGVPRRDDHRAYLDAERGIVAYADPTQGPDNGRAMLGVRMPGAEKAYEAHGHILLEKTIAPTDTLEYEWGFAWDRARNADIPDFDAWLDYLKK